MDATTLKIAIAAFMHDIGKFADKDTLGVTEEYINNHAGLYLPFYNGRHSHHHAVYTAAFIEQMKDRLPKEFNSPGWGEGDSFINLAAGHHLPETPMQWLIAIADRLSSGWERDTFDKEYNRQVAWKDYKKTRLLPLIEQIMLGQNDASTSMDTFIYAYPLREISPETIFPRIKNDITPKTSDEAAAQYRELFSNFKDRLQILKHREECLELWFEHFDSLMMVYTSSIPAARAGDVIPDVSLYDHSRVTSALAVAHYLYHRDTGTLNVEAVKEYDEKKFLIVSGDFYGIQEFISNSSGDTRKYRSKLLRGRSFEVSVFSELAADMFCQAIGLPFSSIILNAAGKFAILAPNTQDTKKCIEDVERRINDWLIEVAYGETTMGFSYVEAAPNDFTLAKFIELWDRISQMLEIRKSQKIDLQRHGGPVESYLDKFNNKLQSPLCPICGKRPSSSKAEGSSYVEKTQSACNICRDHIFLGTNLVKKNRLAITKKGADIKGDENKLFEPIFDTYQMAFIEGDLKEMAARGDLLKYWDLSNSLEGDLASDVSKKFINGYVPKYSEADREDERIPSEIGTHEEYQEVEQDIISGGPKTLEHIASMAKNPTEEKGKFCGIEALGVLRADVDRAGLIMSCGLKPKRFTVSRLATLSRQLHYYFAVYLPYLFLSETKFKDIYTIFAGGDDLFLIGPWNRIIDLSILLKDTFSDYACKNDCIHFSAGISIHKPQTPLDAMGRISDTMLKKSKEGRNRLTVFDETATWNQVEELAQVKRQLLQWLDSGWINNSMLYRLNHFIEMAEEERNVTSDNEIHMDDMSCTKWRSFLSYYSERNIAKQIKGEEREEAINQVTSSMTHWLTEYGGRLRMPLWDILYNKR
ncbi:MAG: type III-A CRISPR-associated protein Cas10/Csm1 [Deltaproteobacteria bacterium]|nr:type III-A CRISPR-associated protein Cas10/Csm1 [Deltaproteobacteria bacterium]